MLVQLSGGFDRTLQKFTLAVLPFRQIKKINLTLKLQLQSMHWSFRFIKISPFPPSKNRFRNTTKLYFCSTRVLASSLLLHGMPNILLVNLWQLMTASMSVQAHRHDRPSWWFSKSQGLPYFFSLPPPHSFICVIFHAVFDSCSSFFALKPHGNTWYAG